MFYNIDTIRIAIAKHSSLFRPIISDEDTMFYNFDHKVSPVVK